MEHVGVVVDDLEAATAFFEGLGLDVQGQRMAEGDWVDRVVGLDGVRVEVAMLQTPDGHGRLELAKFHSPVAHGGEQHAPVNTPGLRHVAFAVEGIEEVVAGLRAPWACPKRGELSSRGGPRPQATAAGLLVASLAQREPRCCSFSSPLTLKC